MKTRSLGLWIGAFALLVLDVGVHCVRAQNDIPDVLKTQNFQIVNSSGMDVVDMDLSKEGSPIIGMNDAKGNVRMGVIVTSDGGHVQMIDTTGKTTLALSGSTAPNVSLFKNDEMKALLGVRETDGWPVFTLGDKEGSDRVFLGYDADKGNSILQISDKTGKQSAEMALEPSEAIVDATDKDANRRAGIMCTSSGKPQVFITDKAGTPVWGETLTVN